MVPHPPPGGEPGQAAFADPRAPRARCPSPPASRRSRACRAPAPPPAPRGRRRPRGRACPRPSHGCAPGCQPLRHSSPIVGFWVQRIGDMVKSPVTQMLHPMHSRMSSGRPSSIFLGRNGSAIDGRAQPMRSTRPFLITDTIRSGDVYLPTATTGFVVSFFTPSMKDSCVPSGPEARGDRVVLPAGQHQVPQVGKLGEESDRVLRLGLLQSVRSQELVHGHAARHRTGVAHRLAGVDQGLLEQANTVLERSAVLVGPVVVPARKEVVQIRQGVPGRRRRRGRIRRARARSAAVRCQRRRSRMSRFVIARAWTGS